MGYENIICKFIVHELLKNYRLLKQSLSWLCMVHQNVLFTCDKCFCPKSRNLAFYISTIFGFLFFHGLSCLYTLLF